MICRFADGLALVGRKRVDVRLVFLPRAAECRNAWAVPLWTILAIPLAWSMLLARGFGSLRSELVAVIEPQSRHPN